MRIQSFLISSRSYGGLSLAVYLGALPPRSPGDEGLSSTAVSSQNDAVQCSPTRQHHLILMSAPPVQTHRTKPIRITCHGDGPRCLARESLTLTGRLINFRQPVQSQPQFPPCSALSLSLSVPLSLSLCLSLPLPLPLSLSLRFLCFSASLSPSLCFEMPGTGEGWRAQKIADPNAARVMQDFGLHR